MNGNLPPGVSSGDPHFYPPDEAPCFCGHVADEHDDEGICMVNGCDCLNFEPDTDPTDEEVDYG